MVDWTRTGGTGAQIHSFILFISFIRLFVSFQHLQNSCKFKIPQNSFIYS
uniref:Uncharacterized protein n=1 Tax=Sphaeramia orbicularis TaxID=375764 RepID=A0A673BU94_9TELE